MTSEKKISIVIVTYQSEKYIYDCVDSLIRYADIPLNQIEIILVDNNSANAQAMFHGLSERFSFPFVFLSNPKNGGYGQGNNLGIRQASAPIILIVNPDVRQQAGYLKQPLQLFEQDPLLSMVGMKQYAGCNRPSKNSFACTTKINGYIRTILTALCNRFDIYLKRLMHFSGACFFVRKDMFEAVGLFDETNFMYGEEEDIHYRLMSRYGAGFRYLSELSYVHLTEERTWTSSYEKKIIDATIRLNEKNGYTRKQSIRHLKQIYRLQDFVSRAHRYQEVIAYLNQLNQ